jgi:menaquinone-dependent protoporphyrinogen IX oxidase
VIGMRALVVYESMYGNTQVIAGYIADGLRGDYEVTLVPVAEATRDLVADADLLVAGAPTHMHGLSTRSTRRMAAQAAASSSRPRGASWSARRTRCSTARPRGPAGRA